MRFLVNEAGTRNWQELYDYEVKKLCVWSDDVRINERTLREWCSAAKHGEHLQVGKYIVVALEMAWSRPFFLTDTQAAGEGARANISEG